MKREAAQYVTPSLVRTIYLAGRNRNLQEHEVDEKCQALFGWVPSYLLPTEAYEFIAILTRGDR